MILVFRTLLFLSKEKLFIMNNAISTSNNKITILNLTFRLEYNLNTSLQEEIVPLIISTIS